MTSLAAPIKPDAAAHSTNMTGSGGTSAPPGNTRIDRWRKKFDDDTKEVGGITYWWFKHHKTKDYEGLYVSSHLPDQHDAWLKA